MKKRSQVRDSDKEREPFAPSPASRAVTTSDLPLSPDQIIQELALERFIPNREELADITEKTKTVLVAQSEKTGDRFAQIDEALRFVETIWRKYDCEAVARIYASFVKIEEALYGLEREEDLGRRYRDHFIHMFNCFVFGIRLISNFLRALPDTKAKAVFKLGDERLREVGLPFGSNYTYQQRIFYLWTLIATFHDIAIPFQHLTRIGKGVNRFIQEFGWIFTDPSVTMRDYDSSQLFHYFDSLSSLFGGNLELVEDGKKYRRPERPCHYLSKLLGREFDRRNHGVLSGFFMWKTIEEVFLVDRSSKYTFGADEFNAYTEYVLEQDVARAALAISLHGIEAHGTPPIYPKVFPLAFTGWPFAFLLILSDELQEYLRWEGVSLRKEMKFSYHPRIKLDVFSDGPQPSFKLTVTFSLDSANQDNVIRLAEEIRRHMGEQVAVSDVDDAADVIGNSLRKRLQSKLLFNSGFRLQVDIYEDWHRVVYSKEFQSES